MMAVGKILLEIGKQRKQETIKSPAIKQLFNLESTKMLEPIGCQKIF